MRIKVLSGGRKNIELPLSDAELNFQMRRIGIEETVPICRLVEVSEQDNPLHKFEGQTVNMDEVNFFAKRMKSMTEYERKVLSAYAEDYGVATMQDLINLTFSMKGLSLLTDFSDARQVGERLYLDEFLGISEEEKAQTNFIEFAEKTLKESRVEVLPYGVFVEHGFEMQEVYNGKTFPSFVASDETVAIVELQNKAGDTEYLYLPTDISSMNKVKERLQVQDYWEMEVTGIENLRLPDILVPMPENIDCVEALTLFNETCQAVKRFDEVQMTQLAMVVEFTGFSSSTEVTSIARLLGEFEVNPFVHNDEEYGKYMVEESGLFDVDELLLPHINYAERMPRNAATQNNNTENMEQQVPFKVTITEHNPERGVLANADVNVAGIMTIRNVKIKQDDYGLTVTMPRTKMPHTEQYKDSVYFADKSMKQQFDMAVETSYQESVLTPVLDQDEPEEGMEQEESAGMSMGM